MAYFISTGAGATEQGVAGRPPPTPAVVGNCYSSLVCLFASAAARCHNVGNLLSIFSSRQLWSSATGRRQTADDGRRTGWQQLWQLLKHQCGPGRNFILGHLDAADTHTNTHKTKPQTDNACALQSTRWGLGQGVTWVRRRCTGHTSVATASPAFLPRHATPRLASPHLACANICST